jgi:predicted ATP-binding protein involved in virulence
MKSKKSGDAREVISQRVEKDREYRNFSKQEKNEKIIQLYKFYNQKASSNKIRYDYHIDFDSDSPSKESFDELQYIYKLKQYDLVNSANVIFHKQECNITSEDMSSGEFAILSTVLSISAAADNPHTLVLLDEPELSLHPNWQMTLIDNLDRALANQVCHMIIATHSHMLVSDLPVKRSFVTQLEKDEKGNLNATAISECTYGWSAEEVLLKVFKTATDRNRYFGERIGRLLEKMGNNSIQPKEVTDELKELQEISKHLSDIDPMKTILNTIVETYK